MPRRVMTGRVVSTKMQKTVVVEVETTKQHPLYRKILRTAKKYMAHDEEQVCKEGDIVEIVESRPMSRHKRWAVASIVKSGSAES